MKKIVITYGTFDLFHIGHLNLLTRLRALGDQLLVGVSTDEFNVAKGKTSFFPYEERANIVRALKCVDLVFPENSWDQKTTDVTQYGATIFGMGSDWTGKFDNLKTHCEVVYLPRTDGISSTSVRKLLSVLSREHISDLKVALDIIGSIVQQFDGYK